MAANQAALVAFGLDTAAADVKSLGGRPAQRDSKRALKEPVDAGPVRKSGRLSGAAAGDALPPPTKETRAASQELQAAACIERRIAHES
jgi:hypothetical protein